MKSPRWLLQVAALLALPLSAASVAAQGITTGAIAARVTDANGMPREGVRVVALHEPSGTRYEARSRSDGSASIPGMRVGGPYKVTASSIGFQPEEHLNVFVSLGVATDLAFRLTESAVMLQAVTVTAETEVTSTFSSARTGAATAVNREAVERLPTVTGRIEDLVRLTPQYSGTSFGFSFAGQDNRLNNVTVDGAYFNNSFGLAGQPGDRTQVAPISLAAIDQILVNIAPYDVRQGNFVGAGINTVTKSGTNDFRGSLYTAYRDQRGPMHGRMAGSSRVNPGEFEYSRLGATLGGPIMKDRLFFFASVERDQDARPGTTFQANPGGAPATGNMTRVLKSDLDGLSTFLKAAPFNFDPGAYEGYTHKTPGMRFLTKLDYNYDDRNKLSLRYSHLDSDTDVLVSTSSSLGFGRTRSTNYLNFQGSNYKIMENIRSLTGEWNSLVSDRYSNNLILGYTKQDESRGALGSLFPFVDILQNNITYTSFGSEPFTPNNELRYSSFQLQNNFTRHGVKHDFTVGASIERYQSENVFFPGSQSVYTYNSLQDFYTDAQDFVANPNRTVSPITLRRFQVRWMNIPGMDKPVQPLKVLYAGVYAQDQWQALDNLRLTAGLRLDVPYFSETGFANPNADALTFRDEKNRPVQYSSAKLPDPSILLSPRFGFNWDPARDRSTQVRGGTGVFSGRPAYVWISNQIGNTGVLTGFQELNNVTTRPFHPDPNHYKPTSVTGAPASSYELALTDKNFKFPQLWRNDIAVDQRLPFGIIATGEVIYNRDLNGIYYINANLPAPQSSFTVGPLGGDNRPRWVGTSCANPTATPCVTRLNNQAGNQVANAVVLKNQNVGRSWNASLQLQRPFSGGSFVQGAYSYGEAKNTVDPGSIAFGSWNNNQHSGHPNDPGLGFSNFSPGHRLYLAGTYRREYFQMGATTIGLYWEARTIGNTSYTFAGDLNGDGGTSNDLIFVPKNTGQMNFQQYTQAASGGAPARTFTAAEQARAWEAYIQQDKYLSSRRGMYAERNAVFLPMMRRADLSLTQDVFTDMRGRRNSLQLRADFLNVGNMINKEWGVAQRMVTNQPLLSQGADAQGRALYRLRNFNTPQPDGTNRFELLPPKTFEPTAGLSDVYRVLLSVRYTFQ